MLGAESVRAYVEAATGAALEDDEAVWLEAQLRPSDLEAGQAYVAEGDVCQSVAFVVAGLLRVVSAHDGDERTVYFASEGQFASDYESFLTGRPARFRIEAAEPVRLLRLPRAAVLEAYGRLRHGERLGRVIAERLFLEANRRLVSFYLDSAEDRYLALIEEQPGLVQRVPQHVIAEYVGVRPQSLSRIRARLAERGSSPG